MILEHLYRISLEPADQWQMFFGSAGIEPSGAAALNIHMLFGYTLGLERTADADARREYNDFTFWLIQSGEFTAEGWSGKLLADAEGNHRAAIQMFFRLVQAYCAADEPQWFQKLNAGPLPSLVVDVHGKPLHEDVRDPRHRPSGD